MGIKMGVARDSAGAEWRAETYAKGKGKEPLTCLHCPTPIIHQSAYMRDLDDKSVQVSAYFRLLPRGRHALGCRFAVKDEIKVIASASDDLFESLRDGKYRLRLVMVRDALSGGISKPKITGNDAGDRLAGKVYQQSQGKRLGYINSAKRVLQLRVKCDEDDEIAEHLELIFEGNTAINWSQFYFETERYMDAYYAVRRNTVQHPIALYGVVQNKAPRPGKYRPTNVLNLVKPKYLANPDDGSNAIGVQVSLWADNAEWFADLQEGTEAIVLGIWKATPGSPEIATKPGKFKTFTTHKLTLNPVMMAQIARAPKS